MMARYLVLTKYDEGLAAPPMSKWEPDDITALLEYLRALNQRLIESGELIEAHALTGPELAKIVVTNGSGPPVITPGYSAASDRGGSDSVPVDAAVQEAEQREARQPHWLQPVAGVDRHQRRVARSRPAGTCPAQWPVLVAPIRESAR